MPRPEGNFSRRRDAITPFNQFALDVRTCRQSETMY